MHIIILCPFTKYTSINIYKAATIYINELILSPLDLSAQFVKNLWKFKFSNLALNYGRMFNNPCLTILTGFPKWVRLVGGDDLGKMTKNCRKMTKLGFLGKNSWEGTWGGAGQFLGGGDPTQSPCLSTTRNPELIQIISQFSGPCPFFRHKVFIRIHKKY